MPDPKDLCYPPYPSLDSLYRCSQSKESSYNDDAQLNLCGTTTCSRQCTESRPSRRNCSCFDLSRPDGRARARCKVETNAPGLQLSLTCFVARLYALYIQEMLNQEKKHITVMDKLQVQHRVRPTILTEVARVAGFGLGAATALMGKEAAMACTEAVETVIGEHYDE